MLQNYMEILLEDVLVDMLKKHELKCNCQRCMEDIKAIALNNVKPMYIASERGIVYSKINEMNVQFRADIISALMKAMAIVEKDPRH